MRLELSLTPPMNLTLERWLPAPPEAVWPAITRPERMNAWSTAPVRLLEPGDGGEPWGVGAMREVSIRVGGVTARLLEVIRASSPPRRLTYRVLPAPFLRHHDAEITLEPERGGTLLRWRVDYRMALPGLGQGARLLLDIQLQDSLDALARVVDGAPSEQLPEPRELDDEPTPGLWRAAQESLEEQRRLADQLSEAGDPKRWFVRMYQYVTDAQLRSLNDGHALHPGWVLRLIPRFHHYYMLNLRRWMGQAPGWVEAHWRRAFTQMETTPRRNGRDELAGITLGLTAGAAAHIEEDLPRALAEVYCRHYAHACDYARFRADYVLMGHVFREAGDRLFLEALQREVPLHRRLIQRYMPPEVKRALGRRSYDLTRAREEAFARGERIALLLRRRGLDGSPSGQAYIGV